VNQHDHGDADNDLARIATGPHRQGCKSQQKDSDMVEDPHAVQRFGERRASAIADDRTALMARPFHL